MLAQVRIGVCACLLQQKVRYDGEQRRSESVADLSATPGRLHAGRWS